MPVFTSPKVEEFYNKNHSPSDGKFTAGRAVKAGNGMGQASWKMSPGQIARQRAANKALGIKPSITQTVKAEQARGIGPARDVSPHATQGRAGSSPAQYRANQLLLIATRKKVQKRLAKKHQWDKKEQNVKDEMYPNQARLRDGWPDGDYSARVIEFYNHLHDAATGRFSGKAAGHSETKIPQGPQHGNRGGPVVGPKAPLYDRTTGRLNLSPVQRAFKQGLSEIVGRKQDSKRTTLSGRKVKTVGTIAGRTVKHISSKGKAGKFISEFRG